MNMGNSDTNKTAERAEVMVSVEGPEMLWIFLDAVTTNVIGYSEVGPEHARAGERVVLYRRADLAGLAPAEDHVPERAMLRVATGLRERASRAARPLERKTLIASAEALETAVSAARPDVP